ncbi:MAG: hypothetical protein P0120_21900 [Nitrospira sp.]|nr:hypothetical protein [Nitrospira sp.]
MGFMSWSPRGKLQKDPKEMMVAAIKSFNSAMQQMRDLPSDDPCPRIWESVIGELTTIIGTRAYNDGALHMRARASYYAGCYKEAIGDINAFFSEGHQYDPVAHGDLSPRTLRAMARIGLQQFSDAEKDLHEEIRLMKGNMDQRSINRSREGYWLLVCKHKGNKSAAIEEQSKFY